MMPRLIYALLLCVLAACAGRQEGEAPRPDGPAALGATPPATEASVSVASSLPMEAAQALPQNAAPATDARRSSVVGAAATRKPGPHAPHKLEAADTMAYAPAMVSPPPPLPEENRERYQAIKANPVHLVSEQPVSTFSIDVDTGSYSNVRRLLQQGQLPPSDAVRLEEMVNYFPYDYALPEGKEPFAVHTELAPAPWNTGNVILRIGIKGRDVARQQLPPANLVFLVDTSGSMADSNKLPLVKSSLKLLVKQLRPQDRITLVTYAGDTSVVLPPTSGADKALIVQAIDRLGAGGGTNGESGIQLAYQMAQQGFVKGGINRILLATDGDFNVGITDFGALKSLVEEKRKSGVSLSTLGYGGGNYNDQLMEQLADAGNGAYSYVDSLMEGHKVLVSEMTSTLATIAKDVKIQIEFNPAVVSEYRLLGYENRVLAREDFNNDKVDAGEIGAGHTVTALYELTLVGQKGMVDGLRYRAGGTVKPAAAVTADQELAFVKLRYKAPDGDTSTLMNRPVQKSQLQGLGQGSDDFRFATAVAGFGQLLRGGKHTGAWSYADARGLAAGATGTDRFGYRAELLRLIDLASALGTPAPSQGAVASAD